MEAEDLLAVRPALDRYLREFADCAVTPTRRHIATYIRGQLGNLPRKSIEPIALDAGVHPRTLQQLLSLHCWDEDLMRRKLHARVAASHGGRHAIGIIDETSFVKKGDKTPGVQRQYCGTTGKTDNCAVTVHLGTDPANPAASTHTQTRVVESTIYISGRRTLQERGRELVVRLSKTIKPESVIVVWVQPDGSLIPIPPPF